jgi:hypothetical protein
VSDSPVLVGKSKVVVRLQPLGDVVGVQQSNLGDLSETLSAEHLDVRPGNGVDRCRAERRGGDGGDGLFAAGLDERVRGEERSKVRFARDGTDTWSTSTVRDGEGLVQVGVRDITSDPTETGQSNQTVAIGPC